MAEDALAQEIASWIRAGQTARARARAEEFRALFPRVAKANGAAFVPFLLEGIGGIAEFNQPDLIHPNEEGQKRGGDQN